MKTMPPRGIAIGIAIQLASLATGYLSLRLLCAMGWFGCLVISAPLFLASAFYIMRATAPLSLRLLLSFWPVAIPIRLAAETAWEHINMRSEIVLIPAGYQGKGIAYFSDPAGAPEELEGGKLVLRLGPNGELRTQAQQRKFASDWVFSIYQDKREYYFVEPNGQRRKPDVITVNDAPDRPGIIPGGAGYESGRIVWIDFYVGTPAQCLKSLENR